MLLQDQNLNLHAPFPKPCELFLTARMRMYAASTHLWVYTSAYGAYVVRVCIHCTVHTHACTSLRAIVYVCICCIHLNILHMYISYITDSGRQPCCKILPCQQMHLVDLKCIELPTTTYMSRYSTGYPLSEHSALLPAYTSVIVDCIPRIASAVTQSLAVLQLHPYVFA